MILRSGKLSVIAYHTLHTWQAIFKVFCTLLPTNNCYLINTLETGNCKSELCIKSVLFEACGFKLGKTNTNHSWANVGRGIRARRNRLPKVFDPSATFLWGCSKYVRIQVQQITTIQVVPQICINTKDAPNMCECMCSKYEQYCWCLKYV